MKNLLRSIQQFFSGNIGLEEVFVGAGAVSLFFGLYQAWPPAAWITLGLLLLFLGRMR